MILSMKQLVIAKSLAWLVSVNLYIANVIS